MLLFAMVFSATVGCQTGIPAAKYPGPVDPDAPEEFTETASGLKYRILRKGDGNNPTAADSVMCHYEGKLINGDVFDSSYTSGQPLTFSLRGVIPGWTEGMQYVREGGMIELEVPSELGYGKNGSPPVIPPDATLRFRVELIAIQ
ncbi:MAG: FKBP-type peptidyl-prolyl cis-trans isomerase [Planctomycetota bacterium]